MNLRIKQLAAAALLTVGFTGAAHAATIAVMDGDHDIIAGLYGGLTGLGHTSTLYADTAGGWSSALASGADAIVVEQVGSDAASIASVASYISAGGRVILLGGEYDFPGGVFVWEESFYEGLIGGAVTTDAHATSSRTYGQTAAAAGTTFASAAATLNGASSTHEVTSGTPASATVFYSGVTGDAVIHHSIGSGDLFYLAWDYCCASSTAHGDAWMTVLDAAIEFDGSTSVPEPATLGVFGLGFLGLALTRRRKQTRC